MGRYRGPEKEVVARSAFVKLMRSAELASADVHRELSTSGLTISQFGVLEALYHLGPLCQKDLAGKILKTAGNITTVINNLEKRGLITRSRNEEDRRYFSVLLTDEGQQLVAELFPPHERRIVERMSRLSLKEQKTLGTLCKKLTADLITG